MLRWASVKQLATWALSSFPGHPIRLCPRLAPVQSWPHAAPACSARRGKEPGSTPRSCSEVPYQLQVMVYRVSIQLSPLNPPNKQAFPYCPLGQPARGAWDLSGTAALPGTLGSTQKPARKHSQVISIWWSHTSSWAGAQAPSRGAALSGTGIIFV